VRAYLTARRRLRHTQCLVKKIPYPPRSYTGPRQIIGLRLPLGLASEVKAEAAQRNISLKNLFGEMWLLYKKNMIITSSRSSTGPRQMIGFSLPQNLAVEVKEEAARRKVAVVKLFAELWPIYKNKGKKGA
jgi:hypothetical protein